MFHDASACVIEDGHIMFAGHSERYSRDKNDPFLNKGLIRDALKHGLPDVIVLHESTKLKKQTQTETNELEQYKSCLKRAIR